MSMLADIPRAIEMRPDNNARDPFTLELIRNSLAALADEMALTIHRTARSFVVKEALDFSTALFLADGELIAQGTCLPFHLGAMPFAVKAIAKQFEGSITPGDLYITNDPYDGSTHLPDIVLVKPIFVDDRHLGYSVALAHMTDIGGRMPGGNASDSTELYQEGLRIPPGRLWRAGEPDEFMFRLIARNVRVPDKVLGDVRSLIAACSVGERELIRLARRHGVERFERCCRELLDYTERFTRREIAKLPKGTWRFVDHLDNDGIDPDPIRIEASVTIAGDEMTIDLTGSSPQVRGAINCVYPFTLSTALACVRSILDLSIPNNAGYFRPIRVIAPRGSVVNPNPPAAVAARGITGIRIADTIFGALAQAVPHIVPACGANAPDVGISFGGTNADGTPFVYLEFLVGSWGGGPDRDGMDACTGTLVNYSNAPCEMIEADQPIVVERYAFVADTGGPGRYRGGLAIERHLRFRANNAVLQIRSDRRDHPPYGLQGGRRGAPSDVRIRRADGRDEPCPAKFLTTVHDGDVLLVRLAGGGGHGDALARESAAVLADVVEEKMSVEHAQDAYGVVISGTPPCVGDAATTLRRDALLRSIKQA
ncbi:MAG TPA: hydantoinase B/oxoprolinase family protein [Casimicrobiaceae bacterium]|nr:hydantoinase B/oxoprolinase family protein [Casimicrobiaceae bacterium]